MALYPLKERIHSLPLILAGPILRQVSPTDVTVWIALRAPAQVVLTVREATSAGGWGASVAQTPAPMPTVALGPNLHMLAVTAKAVGGPLQPGKLYGYNLTFTGATPGDLFTPGIFSWDDQGAQKWLTYQKEPGMASAPSLPSFVLRPEDPNLLRLCQGSCRKAHGEGVDGLANLDTVIAKAIKEGTEPRPHMLMLGGDQIYADDVSDAFLQMLIDAGEALIGKETLPGLVAEDNLNPGMRWGICERIKLTAGADGGQLVSKSHLLQLGEWYSAYLFAWSDVLWPTSNAGYSAGLPTYQDVYDEVWGDYPGQEWSALSATPKTKVLFEKESRRLATFWGTLRQVRRALANVPTYMIFDDHEVTDDWFINREWTARLLRESNPTGRRVILNGMLAYTLCQGWGNSPEQFESPTSVGGKLLAAATGYHGAPDQEAKAAEITECLGIPTYTGWKETYRPANPLRYHFRIKTGGWELIALDTRTMRGYTGGRKEIPDLLSPAAFELQIPKDPVTPDWLTMVVAPTNVISEWLTETAVEVMSEGGKKPYGTDAGDAWAGQREGFERLLSALADRAVDTGAPRRQARVVVLTGDIHYGFAFRLQYWGDRPYKAKGSKPVDLVMAELTASSFKNEAAKTRALHDAKITQYMPSFWWGWAQPPAPEAFSIRNTTEVMAQALKLPELDRAKLEAAPALMGIEHLPWVRHVSQVPQWRYRIDMMPDLSRPPGETAVNIGEKPATLSPSWFLEGYRSVAFDLWGHLYASTYGRYVVGRDNLGDVRFRWGPGNDKEAIQRLWWRLADANPPEPLTTFRVSLNFNEVERFPRPTYPGEAVE